MKVLTSNNVIVILKTRYLPYSVNVCISVRRRIEKGLSYDTILRVKEIHVIALIFQYAM